MDDFSLAERSARHGRRGFARPYDHLEKQRLRQTNGAGAAQRRVRHHDPRNLDTDAVFDTLDRALFVMNGNRVVHHANRMARSLIDDGVLSRDVYGRLVVGDKDITDRFDKGLCDMSSGRIQTFRVHRPIGDGHWLIMDLRRIPQGESEPLKVALKVRSTSEDAPAGAWTATVSALRLSPAEADVAFCIFRTLCAKEIAKELGVSPNTVKSHLRSIYAKCGCSGYAETLRILLSLTRP